MAGGNLETVVVVKVTHHGFYATNKESMLSPLAIYTTSPMVLLCVMFFNC